MYEPNELFFSFQLLVGTPGNEPEECARDFIKNCYKYYPCGVYWYDASNELTLEASVMIAYEVRTLNRYSVSSHSS